MTLMWPDKTLRPASVQFDIAPRSVGAPTSVSGFRQVVASDAGLWKATFSGIAVRGKDSVLTFRAIAVRLEGQLNPILVPRCRGYQPIPDNLPDDFADQVPHDDAALFDDDTGYEGGAMTIRLASDLPVRATTASFAIVAAGTLVPGQDFSIGERMYRLATVDLSGANATVTFRPPLREAAIQGTEVNFDSPVCRMRLASDQEMNLDLASYRFGAPTVNFIEDV